jgi:hypothetical protein
MKLSLFFVPSRFDTALLNYLRHHLPLAVSHDYWTIYPTLLAW